MNPKLNVTLPTRSQTHPIFIGQGVLDHLAAYCREIAPRVCIISDKATEKLYGNILQQRLSDSNLEVSIFSFPAGELSKTRSTKEALEDRMLAKGLGRDTVLIALGGGIVTDVAGFVASTYCRGIPLIHVPTTLLAMVDASIGGKTAVNTSTAKNMIGANYQPKAIFMDLDTLKTLPVQELKNGLVECLKHGLIADSDHFHFLENHVDKVLRYDFSILEKIVLDSCRIKIKIVEQDPFETGQRRLLNFGHTIGHAIETMTQHAIPHGRAVAMGIIAESYLSLLLGHLQIPAFEKIVKVFSNYQIDTHLDVSLNLTDLMKVMKLDKKAIQSTPRFVILKEIGRCLDCEGDYCQQVDQDKLRNMLEWFCGQYTPTLT